MGIERTADLKTNLLLVFNPVWVSLKTPNALNAVSSRRTVVTI